MRKLAVVAYLSIFVLTGVLLYAQQDKSKRPSPPGTANVSFADGKQITVDYSRPKVNDTKTGQPRKIFGGVTILRQKFVFFPNLTNSGEYRINFDFSQATTLRKWLAWQVTVSNRYLSNPVPGRKTNDLILTTGFRITFAPPK